MPTSLEALPPEELKALLEQLMSSSAVLSKVMRSFGSAAGTFRVIATALRTMNCARSRRRKKAEDERAWKSASLRRRLQGSPVNFSVLFAMLGPLAGPVAAAEKPGAIPPQQPGQGAEGGKVYRAQIIPHWFQNDTGFWYRNDLRGDTKGFVLVDVESATRTDAFDHERLAANLSKAATVEYKADRLPFDAIDFTDNSKAVHFKVGDMNWECDLTSYECTKTGAKAIPSPASETAEKANEKPPPRPGPNPRPPESDDAVGLSERSLDGKWTAFIKDHNVFIRSGGDDVREIQLSRDGRDGLAYGQISWAPDSKTLVAFRLEPGERKEVYLIQSSPPNGGRAQLQKRTYALPGDKFTTYELNLFDMASQKQMKPELDGFEHEWLRPRLRWNKDGRHFAYQKTDRGHQRFRVIEVDSHTGEARSIIDEKTETFIWTAHTENLDLSAVNWLEKTDEIIYASERDGWRHLYLIDAKEGKIKNHLTTGEYVVRAIDLIDEDNRKVWFRASGKNPEQDPYLLHYYRVNFDGTGLVALTEGNGNHSVQFSPDRKYLIDTYSRVDTAPVNELRRVSDGKLVCKLEEADISELTSSSWEAPEVFVAAGRDGQTGIWGIICRPPNFDPNKKYPVIEEIYAGPQWSYVPKTFSPKRRFASLTDLGFVVVQIDGMGTANRSKAFHDVCWKNLKDAGLPDRILWHKAVAARYPWFDISRVGVYGNSAGGQNAAGAVLFHPEFYKAAVASCGCHDNRMDKASWNEQWMGYPVGPQYAECSNIESAHRLRGKLLLMVGEMDTNVPPESTMRFVDALIRAGKDFELLVVPNGNHGMGGAYGQRRMQDFFVKHLLGVEPPDRNAPVVEGTETGSK